MPYDIECVIIKMKSQQFLRIVEEICIILKMNQQSVHKVIEFYKRFEQSDTHKYRNEIIIAACIFLVSKIDQHQHKIRDIVNVCYLITSLYKLVNRRKDTQGIEYLSIQFLKPELSDKNNPIWKQLIPSFPLDKFNALKKDILQAEQHLLRIVKFQVENNRLKGYKQLVGMMQKFKLNQRLRELTIKIYNDSIFTDAAECPKSCVYFSIQLGLRSGLVSKEEIMQGLSDMVWWQTNMDVSEDSLLDYGIIMMEYYEDS